MVEYHSAQAFVREEPRIELIERLLASLLDVVELEYQGHAVQVDGFRLRNLEQWRTAREDSLQGNLGSFSTACNCKCKFCYEDGNPAGLFAKQPRFVSLAEAETRRRYLHDGCGLMRESKGFFEPFTNPELFALLRMIREHDPEHIIDVTTNGARLTEETVAQLADLKPIYVNVSLISADPSMRREIMRDPHSSAAIEAMTSLQAHRIPFMGTVVPWPEQGLEDVEAAIRYMDACRASVIRISLPGLTRHHPRYAPGLLDDWVARVTELGLSLRKQLPTPIIISPWAYVSVSLEPIVEGVVAASPAHEAGIELGDRISAVDERDVVSRAHATSLLRRAAQKGSVTLEIERGKDTIEVRLRERPVEADAYPYKPSGYQPLSFPGLAFGLVLPGSFHLEYVKQIQNAIRARGAQRSVVCVSPFYHDLVAELLGGLRLPEGCSVELVVPRSEFFGGNVSIGDLWVLDDIANAVKPLLDRPEKLDLLLLPDSFLSRWGRDLRGISYAELAARLDVDIALIHTERITL